MVIPLNNGEMEIPQDWIDEWNKVYYDVPRTLQDIRIWCLDNPSKRKTKRGLRAFLGRWIRKDCTRRPVVEGIELAKLRREAVAAPVESKESRLAHLATLKAALK